MKRVCMIVEDYPPGGGGGGIFVKEISKRLASEYDISIFTKSDYDFEKIECGFRIKYLKGPRSIFLLKSIWHLLTSKPYTIYHGHGFLSGLIIKIVGTIRKKPQILHIHGYRDKKTIGAFRFFLQNFILGLGYNKIISVDETSSEKIRSLNTDNVDTIPCGIDLSAFQPSEVSRNIILFVGRLEKVKNISVLLKAIQLLKGKSYLFELHIVGTGSLENQLKYYCKIHKLENVKFLGYIGHDLIPGFYSKSKFFILPSLSEGNPLSLLEAMASGLPFLVSDIPPLVKITEKSQGGLSFKRNNSEDLADSIESFLNLSPKQLNDLRKNARKYAEENFSWDKTINSIKKIYRSLD